MADDSHVFVGINALLVVILVCVALFLAHQLKKYNFTYLPDSGAAMLLGMIVGGFINLVGNEESQYVMFKPELFFFILLPPIIFEAGYTMKKARFFSNFWTILVYAVLGTLVSTVIIGFVLFAFAAGGVVPLDSGSPIECLAFGALLSATDPVATLSILGSPRMNVDPLLYSLVFGESVLNDAVAIVLYNTFKGFDGSAAFTHATFWKAVGTFLGISIGSLVVGVLVALVCSFMFKHAKLHDKPSYEFVLTFFFAYASFCIAEIISLSGIMALFFCGIVMAHYASYNISPASRQTTYHAFAGFALICETFLFAYLGITFAISFRPVFHLNWSFPLIVITLLLCFLSRALQIFPFSYLLNLKRKVKISMRMQIMLWFAGLRGAIAFALALNFGTKNKDVVATTTMSIVIFTTLVCGGTTAPMLRALGLTNSARLVDNEEPLVGQPPAPSAPQHRRVVSGIHARWRGFDDIYMKRWFGGQLSHRSPSSDEVQAEGPFELGEVLMGEPLDDEDGHGHGGGGGIPSAQDLHIDPHAQHAGGAAAGAGVGLERKQGGGGSGGSGSAGPASPAVLTPGNGHAGSSGGGSGGSRAGAGSRGTSPAAAAPAGATGSSNFDPASVKPMPVS